jgi:hypothetical protein
MTPKDRFWRISESGPHRKGGPSLGKLSQRIIEHSSSQLVMLVEDGFRYPTKCKPLRTYLEQIRRVFRHDILTPSCAHFRVNHGGSQVARGSRNREAQLCPDWGAYDLGPERVASASQFAGVGRLLPETVHCIGLYHGLYKGQSTGNQG